MTTNDVKPYTAEEIEELRQLRCLDRMLATLDELDRQLAEAMPPRALREWREGWSPLVGAMHVVVQALDERTRERDEARKWLTRERDKLALAKMSEARLIDERDALRARAEKAERDRDALRGDAERWADVCRSVGRDTATNRAADDVSDAVSVLRDAGAPDLPIDEQCIWLVGQRDAAEREAASLREEVARLRAGWDAAERRLYDAEAWVRTLDDVESVAVRALEHYAVRAYESATDSDGQVQHVAEEALAAMRAIRAAHGRPQQHEDDDEARPGEDAAMGAGGVKPYADKGGVVNDVNELFEAARAALDVIDELAESHSYGSFPGGDPRAFTPHPECSTDEERAAWARDCEAMNAGGQALLPPTSEWYRTENGVAHVHRAAYGLGTYVMRDEELARVADRLRAAIEHAERRLSEATAWAAERRRREEQGVDVCEVCSADVPWGTGATDEEGVTLCPSCLGEEVGRG